MCGALFFRSHCRKGKWKERFAQTEDAKFMNFSQPILRNFKTKNKKVGNNDEKVVTCEMGKTMWYSVFEFK